ncbi:bifunctional phosphopantothenoylcysteine decarboxylase/phosphopantothenate--cysteine ligase CoaBC [Paucidesulfovibrio longus]|uniref:bifunctional phosphopantothenoylcysteine decarboxylase/phosphopantothenate--cysteine ligase CoaBC n=1 Tax=Paucidesulfovibrio longus TaxID=889 RepID=UPI0003B2E674|nr:bifunctional phosphopantothenoylcysteine decarboxylase/phosphopantothenate--cysteine ligase CoaBC [Paucidesulfovibrio longus]
MDTDLLFRGYLGKRVHLGVTGSVAAYKAIDLVRGLLDCNVSVSATLTDAAAKFVTPLSFAALGADPVYGAMFADGDDPYAHLGPGRAADVLAVAPCTANSLAKFACGLADDMLSCQVLAHAGPLLLAPAMNPAMWEAPATKENVARLRDRGVELVFPGSGKVACGDVGNGRLAPVAAILGHVCRLLSPQDLSGVRVLLTLGPTREKFDAVRFWSNPSTGRMGACLATAAWLRGAQVHVVAGPCSLQLPDGVARTDVTSAREMHAAVSDLWPDMDIACCTAAVADFRPRPFGETKMKKDVIGEGGLTVAFDSNPDILAGLGASKRRDQRLIGFAAETDDLRANAAAKLERKNLDLIVANPVNAHGSGFGSRTNSVLVLDRTGRREEWPSLDKSEVAWRIWDHLAEI